MAAVKFVRKYMNGMRRLISSMCFLVIAEFRRISSNPEVCDAFIAVNWSFNS